MQDKISIAFIRRLDSPPWLSLKNFILKVNNYKWNKNKSKWMHLLNLVSRACVTFLFNLKAWSYYLLLFYRYKIKYRKFSDSKYFYFSHVSLFMQCRKQVGTFFFCSKSSHTSRMQNLNLMSHFSSANMKFHLLVFHS